VITDARNAAKCSTRGMCNAKAHAYVKNAVPKRKQPKKKMNTGKQKNTGKQGRKKVETNPIQLENAAVTVA